MPELPEVETVVRTLESQIQDCRIEDISIRYAKIIDGDPEEFKQVLTGQCFRGFSRRGKYLLFYMDDVLFVSHLRMEGKFFLKDPDEPYSKHEHVCFLLDNGKELRYHDTRKFGRMELLDKETDLTSFHGLGPEPFDEAFNQEYIHRFIKGKRTKMKSLLLDQSFVAGIGNIYADEILFACGIRPGRSCAYLSKAEEEAIISETRHILRRAIAAGGTTIRTYTSSLGVTGLFQLECNVHEQKVCRKCGSNIKMKWIGGRSSYYCPVCQKR